MIHLPHLKNQWHCSQSSVLLPLLPFPLPHPSYTFIRIEPHMPSNFPSRSPKANLSDTTIFTAKSIPFKPNQSQEFSSYSTCTGSEPPHQPLLQFTFPLTTLRLLLLPSLPHIEIVPYQRPIFWTSDKKTPKGNPLWLFASAWWIWNGTAYFPCAFQLIYIGKLFLFIHFYYIDCYDLKELF